MTQIEKLIINLKEKPQNEIILNDIIEYINIKIEKEETTEVLELFSKVICEEQSKMVTPF